ncbi:HAUS augmin-like complex subunit 6 N-terminus-domain-containing protein [Lasiosphaeria miniovina]|uniref:HAUS augmin-like complex subunit 6 N-terminus-domain-containing protein n=1 Tax=Lasiosphaeria miniovina TaxID=1954250 RepID=A0AA40AU10_9PEZI|nr:HAUS augmin-like complex subunit 6 N-terminus-domain-containing protein [Lasiosphaeria miniovina]KAK0721961.1 HAUS augmin-like complex subunit 6 N-terminus-domain-containing protein [Lasiosphaeria miniovina]
MANLHATSSLARTRSSRLPPNTSTLGPGSSRPLPSNSASSATFAPQTTAANPTALSNVSLFLTNLRLLDLDLHPDWPGISALTFSTKDVAQGQKKRIQCIEWALYFLFTLWDPDEARNKLQPFFPPLDQVQSLNLRAALLRCLEQAKKNGVLGRDAVVRKTMLDECKGERLEEVLAVFSSAVLKKLVAEQQLNQPQHQHPALAQSLALENRGYSSERTELVALILAHKASLRQTLDGKNAARAWYSDFSNLLALKEKLLSCRREQAETLLANEKHETDISDDLKLQTWRTVRNNWSGSELWMEALLYGDGNARKDGLLSTPFDRVWRRVEAGRLTELENKSTGLVQQLEDRVKSQKERLAKWQTFRQTMFGKTGTEPPAREASTQPKQRGIDLGFREHENLHLGRLSPRKLPRNKPHELHGEYDELVKGLEAELARISPNISQVPSFFQRPSEKRVPRPDSRLETQYSEPEAISELSDLDDEPLAAYRAPLFQEPSSETDIIRETFLRRSQKISHGRSLSNTEQPPPPSPRLRRSATIQAKHSMLSSRRPANGSPTRSPERRPSPPPPRASPTRFAMPPRTPPISASPERGSSPERDSSPERAVSPTQQLANLILASVNAASPSPIKKPRHTLSLAERTRLSMARRTSHATLRVAEEDEEADEEPEIDRLPIERALAEAPATPQPATQPSHGNENGHDEDETDGYEDLVSRTRRSMAGFEAARQKAQLERRRSLRKSKQVLPGLGGGGRNSYFPAVNEEENTTLVLTEELISGGQDYDEVFMSRPKIKTSPVGTPSRAVWDDDDMI